MQKQKNKNTNISGCKKGVIHVTANKEVNAERQQVSRAFGDSGQRQCRCAVNRDCPVVILSDRDSSVAFFICKRQCTFFRVHV